MEIATAAELPRKDSRGCVAYLILLLRAYLFLSLRAEGAAIPVGNRDEIASGLAPLATTVGLAPITKTVEEAECH